MDKTKGVMTALKGRSGFGSKKGVALLGIVQKLTAKRKAMKDGSGGPGTTPKLVDDTSTQLKKKDGAGGPGWDKVKTGAKNLGYDAMDVVERGKLKPNEIPMRHQPDFVKKAHLSNLPRTIGSKVGGAIGAGIGSAAKSIMGPVGMGAKKLMVKKEMAKALPSYRTRAMERAK